MIGQEEGRWENLRNESTEEKEFNHEEPIKVCDY